MSEKKYWIYGYHAVEGAINNPLRQVFRLVALKQAEIPENAPIPFQREDRDFFTKQFGAGAVHQGIAAQISSLPPVHLDEICEGPADGPLILLDQLTDPHNVGAIMRSAAAFGALAVITTDKHTPEGENPALLKAASGAFEHVPYIRVVNMNRTMEQLKKEGYWLMGLDEKGDVPLHKASLEGKIAFVLGAEGSGLRRLTRDACDFLFHIETQKIFSTLNVSNAAAVSLYAWASFKGRL